MSTVLCICSQLHKHPKNPLQTHLLLSIHSSTPRGTGVGGGWLDGGFYGGFEREIRGLLEGRWAGKGYFF
jgi:hypothetical protein